MRNESLTKSPLQHLAAAALLAAALGGTALVAPVPESRAFGEAGCGAGECISCHHLGAEEAAGLLEGLVDGVDRVGPAEVPGLYLLEVRKDGRSLPLYLDFSKSFIISGAVYRLKSGENVTETHLRRMNPVDVDAIPLDDALLLGRADAPKKVIVFTDPQCPYCRRLHAELREVVAADQEIAFLIKLYPLTSIHPDSRRIAESIVCTGSLPLLEASFAGEEIPDPACETTAVDETIALAKKLGIRSTPTLILPDGVISPGFKEAEEIQRLLAPPDGASGE